MDPGNPAKVGLSEMLAAFLPCCCGIGGSPLPGLPNRKAADASDWMAPAEHTVPPPTSITDVPSQREFSVWRLELIPGRAVGRWRRSRPPVRSPA